MTTNTSAPAGAQDSKTTPAEHRDGLGSLSFIGLVITQFLGTINDNMYRWLAVSMGTAVLGASQEGAVLSIGLVCMTIPYVVLATHAGWFADRFSKRKVIIACKVAEILIAILGGIAIWTVSIPLMFCFVFVLGAQSALYAPAKSGIIPELVPSSKLSLGNGVMGLATITAAAMGTIAGFALYEVVAPPKAVPVAPIAAKATISPTLVVGSPAEAKEKTTAPAEFRNLWIPGAAFLAVALGGVLSSTLIRRVPNPAVHIPFPVNPFAGYSHQMRQLWASKPILRTAIGVAFFWSLASLANLNIPLYASQVLGAPQSKGILLAVLVVGVGFGSVLAGIWSRGKVELGIIPVGAAGMVLSLAGLFITGALGTSMFAFVVTIIWLLLLGISSGLFDVPLEAYLQDRSPPEARGNILAATNLLTFSSMIGVAGLFYLLTFPRNIAVAGAAAQMVPFVSPRLIFLLAGLITIPVVWYIFFLIPSAALRFIVWLSSQFLYRVRIYGENHVPAEGGALIVSNHVTWIDGVLLMIMMRRPIRMIAHSDNITKGFIGWMAATMRTIPINPSEGPKSVVRSLQAARKAVEEGELVCIFAEGALTRLGQVLPFQRGLMKIIEGTGCPIVPLYLDGLWGSVFSYRGGKFFWKRPRNWPYDVAFVFGEPIVNPTDVHMVRQKVLDLGITAGEYRLERRAAPVRQFLRKCRSKMFQTKVSDSTGSSLSGGQTLMRSLIVRRVLGRLLAPDEQMVGVLLPPSVGGTLVNTALSLSRRVPVNLNYTVTQDTLNHCVEQCKIRHVITSRKFLEKMKFELNAEFVYLEDFAPKVGLLDKLVTGVQAYLEPIWVLERRLGLTRVKANDLATIIFTSGSTGEPKGVMLTMHNIGSNIDAIDKLLQLNANDSLLGVLPFFHSFGFTVTLWTPLCLDAQAVYHYNPLDARTVGQLCEKHKVTILMSTPTFLRGYIKRCESEQFKSLNLVVVGAEKMPIDLAAAFEEKFKVRPIEGYGTTELSPLASVNIPDYRTNGYMQQGTREGTVGRPIPDTNARIVDPDTWVELGVNEPGLLLIKGPNVMQGYLNKPEQTAKVIKDGWYVTGDIAKIDSDGFITITDRQSRFSKIGGEMVPHLQVESMINQILALPGEEQDVKAVVTSVPDERKGERLIVVHKAVHKTPDEILKELGERDLPNLWIPGRDAFMQVDEIPILGTGKLDLKGIKLVAMEKFGAPAVAT